MKRWTRNEGKKHVLPDKTYLPRKPVYSAKAIRSAQWMRRVARVDACKTKGQCQMHAGVRRDGKRFIGTVKCHAAEHDKCRPSEAGERIRALMPRSLITLGYRKTKLTTQCRDWRHLTFAKRINRFMHLMRKVYGTMKVFWVREVHQDGNPHGHIALSVDIPETEDPPNLCSNSKDELSLLASKADLECLSEFAKACGLGYNVRWERLKGDGMYLVKYLDKQARNDASLNALFAVNKVRAWNCSKGLKPPRTELEYWYYKRSSDEKVAAHYRCSEEEAREELDKRRDAIRDAARQKESKREAKQMRKLRRND